jgi:iron complex outermembrane receptor protein
MHKSTLTALRAGVAPLALAIGFVGAPAFAQDTPAPVTPITSADVAEDSDEVIYVTGSILSRTNTETPAPVTVLTTETLEARGINTVAEGLQRISANGSGTISEGWNNGNNFAAGANAV